MVGGTNFDSSRGAELLRSHGIECVSIGLSENPDVQSEMYLHPEIMQNHFHEKVGKHDFENIIIFCNSLSFAGPWQKIYGQRVTELTAIYTKLLQRVNLAKTAIIVAEENTKAQLRKLAEKNKIHTSDSLYIYSNLNLIKQIEIADAAMQRQLILAEIDALKNRGFTEIIFGCTHLDHEDFYDLEDVKVHQPGLEMLAEFVRDNSKQL